VFARAFLDSSVSYYRPYQSDVRADETKPECGRGFRSAGTRSGIRAPQIAVWRNHDWLDLWRHPWRSLLGSFQGLRSATRPLSPVSKNPRSGARTSRHPATTDSHLSSPSHSRFLLMAKTPEEEEEERKKKIFILCVDRRRNKRPKISTQAFGLFPPAASAGRG